jgi:hypothetical protein
MAELKGQLGGVAYARHDSRIVTLFIIDSYINDTNAYANGR